MGKKLAFWGDCNGCGYKIIRILEELGGINVTNYCGAEVTSLYYIDEKNRIKCTYNGDLDKEKYVVMTYHDFIAKYPRQLYDIVYTVDNHEEGKIVEIVWDETAERMKYLVEFETAVSWMCADEIFSYVPKDNSDCGTAIKPMKVKSNAVKIVDNKVVDNLDKGKNVGKKLAIRGHSTRGNEVIELLEMMGGKNKYYYKCIEIRVGFTIGSDGSICRVTYNLYDEFKVFTLEEFLEKYPFKVGDKVIDCYGNPVTIKSMSWHDGFETMVYDFEETEDVFCAEDLELYKEDSNMRDKEDKLFDSIIWHLRNSINNGKQNMSGGECERYFRELVDKVKETITPSPDITAEVTDKNNCNIGCPNGYVFYDENGNLIGTKVMMKPKKPKYPDNYEECVRIAKNIHGYDIHIDTPAYRELMESFVKLLICRDAYWKIAGEEMGLGKPWEPDWNDEIQKYCIRTDRNKIVNCSSSFNNRILAFPSEEMRDAFYVNFKDLIENCKELL